MERIKPGEGGYLILLCSLASLLIAGPLAPRIPSGGWFLSLFVTFVLMASVWAVARSTRQVVAVAVILVVLLVDRWIAVAGGRWLDEATGMALMLVFFAWVAGILARDVFTRRSRINADVIYGGVNVYLLIGLAYASAHQALAELKPAAYDGLDATATLTDAIYFSFVTLTTLGYGDILPLTPGARLLAYSEALLGQLYIAILLARLVAMQITASVSKEPR
jgi:hypothetical protein